ncbi:uncharacterized protein TNCV_628571 [Trichonephila clavipes]|nr:uncharacterized protein TNCV_628571 [Trichonephila clavipes]
MEQSLNHLQRYHEEECGVMSQIVTSDETCCHHFEPESKHQNIQWIRATSPPRKKSKSVCTSYVRVMMSFFLPQCPTAYLVSGRVNHHHCPALSNHFSEL